MIRRFAAAVAALLAVAILVPACGGVDPRVEEPVVRSFVRDLARALIQNDKEKVAAFILPMAGQGNNPLGAQEWDNPEGREKIRDGNRRQLRQLLLDAGVIKEEQLKTGIVDEAGVTRLDQAMKIYIDGKNARGTFELAAGPHRMAEDVTWLFAKTEQGWRLADYDRQMKR